MQKTDDTSGNHLFSFGLHDTASNGTLYTPGLAQRRGANDRFFHADWLGSTRYLTNDTGNQAPTALRFDAYGKRSAVAGPDDPTDFQYAGAWGYETEAHNGLRLQYLYQRYYDPETGSFISRDPIGWAGGLNLYGYTGNDPVNGVDPSGLANVEVRFKGVLGANHAYIIITENDGSNPYIIRFGQDSNVGPSSGSLGASGGASSQSFGKRSHLLDPTSGSSHSSNSSSPGICRGGKGRSNGLFGPITKFAGPYDSNAPDYTEQSVPSISIISADHRPASYYQKRLGLEAQKIYAAEVTYNPFTTNSNAGVTTALSRAGLIKSPPKPPVWVPGWYTKLPR